jgi:hypothetical protein
VRQCPIGLNTCTEPITGEAVEMDGADVGGPGNGVHAVPLGTPWAGPRRFTLKSLAPASQSRCRPNRLESRMRENRTYGSEGAEAQAFPTPIQAAHHRRRASGVRGAGARCRWLGGS